MNAVDLSAEQVFQRICDFAMHARSILHLPFATLEGVNPSFAVIAKYCEMCVVILNEEAHRNVEHAENIMQIMQDIAIAIVDRDNEVLVDCMAMLDEFFDNHDIKKFIAK